MLQQIANVSGRPKLVSVRAGNVIGGGDFAADRIIPDIIRAVISGHAVEFRNPESTRPWQHALDPLAGYFRVLESCLGGLSIPTINFGPFDLGLKVKSLTEIAQRIFRDLEVVNVGEGLVEELEAKTLNLNSKLANDVLGWQPNWSQEEAIRRTFEWWYSYLNYELNASELCKKDVSEFVRLKGM